MLLYLYDAAPTPLKSIGLGEAAAFLVWGPLMVGGGYFAIAGHLSAIPFVVSIPYGLGVASILLGKHIDQADFDRSHGQRTLPVVLGEAGARRLTQAVLVLMYVGVALFAVGGWLHPETPPPGYVGWPLWYHRACLVHNRLFGWVYIAGLAVGVVASRIGT